jgi:hypothetical protein
MVGLQAVVTSFYLYEGRFFRKVESPNGVIFHEWARDGWRISRDEVLVRFMGTTLEQKEAILLLQSRYKEDHNQEISFADARRKAYDLNLEEISSAATS